MIRKCEICGRELVEEDVYFSCPVFLRDVEYMDNPDEHTSDEVK